MKYIHRFPLLISKGCRFLIKPTCLHASIVTIHTMDCRISISKNRRDTFAKPFQGYVEAPYLDCEVEKVQVPVRTRHDVFVDDGHTDRGETVGKDGNGRAVLDLGDLRVNAGMGCGSRRTRGNERVLLSAERTAHTRVGHADSVVFVLLVRHDCEFGTVRLEIRTLASRTGTGTGRWCALAMSTLRVRARKVGRRWTVDG